MRFWRKYRTRSELEHKEQNQNLKVPEPNRIKDGGSVTPQEPEKCGGNKDMNPKPEPQEVLSD